MTLSGSDALFYTLAFLVPGFIWQWALAALVPQRKEDAQLLLLRFLTLSCANYGLWSWLIYIIFRTEFSKRQPLWSAFLFFVIVFVSPLLLGLLTGRCSQKDIIRNLLLRLGFNPVHAVPVSWDYKFGKVRPGWIIVTLTDGSEVAGYFGTESFASSESGDRDLYMEQVWKIQENGDWEIIERSDGILLCSNQIKYIEFIRSEEEEQNA